MTSTVIPVFNDAKFLGVVGVDLLLTPLAEMVNGNKPYPETVPYLISNAGTIVTTENNSEFGKPFHFQFGKTSFEKALKSGQIEFDTEILENQEYLITAKPFFIGPNEKPWIYLSKTPMTAINAAATSLLWNQILIAVAGLALMLVTVILIARAISNRIVFLTSSLRESEKTLSEAIESLTSSGRGLSESSNTSAASIEETVASLQETTSMVKVNAENAQAAAELSTKSQSNAQQGEQEMRSLVNAMTEISEASKKIEDITNVIDDIAFQTNLLALNAAVEAARAGEQVKGFAVVAEAVRSLAQRSAEAAKDINSLIHDSVEKSERGADKATESSSVHSGIVTSIEKLNGINAEISNASNEQSQGVGQISAAMNDIDRSIQSNAATASAIADNVDSIFQESQKMSQVVDQINDLVFGKAS